jgi:hypothetical protein
MEVSRKPPHKFRGVEFIESITSPSSPSSDQAVMHWETGGDGWRDCEPLKAYWKLSDPDGEQKARKRLENTVLYIRGKDGTR